MNSLESRISALERNWQRNSGVELVIIRGGLHVGDPTFGKVGKMHLERGEDEAFPTFVERARAAAAFAGERRVILGGLWE